MQKRKSVLPRSKLDLLPLPRVEMDRLSLVSHLALADLSTGTGSMRSFAILANTVVLTHFLMGEGFGAAGDGREILERAKGAVNACDKAATLAGKWTVEGEDYRWLGRCLTLHDRQLRIAPRQAVAMAVIRRDAYWAEQEKRKSLKKAA
ncbi:hypothetical protein A9R05_43035 (plasmid) [Burkholderia sp. KK1]|uniref:hypothetical protein n=1 Tax=Burkholderia sp. M701 TaxID=326454 RepID=UPI000979A380|nr:hypothetical protein [Burkholderia sp. M701]AQH06076.1 hypothetical protein A9R05_43035 [Burkholderia sp. KK1]